ncbi:MAG: T9SS type A sorting domain-containing protein [Bacteroidia bacterium]|nr:T9SS type A sorting domain-containing protein [Bacteroidia bacterium]
MKLFTRILSASFAFTLFLLVAAPQAQAQWTPCGMPLDFGDYYDDMPGTNPGDIAIQPVVNVSPNPSSGTYMRVVYRQLEKPGTLALYDLSGRKVAEAAVNSTTTESGEYKLLIAGIAPGTYVLSLTDGTNRVSQKVLIR